MRVTISIKSRPMIWHKIIVTVSRESGAAEIISIYVARGEVRDLSECAQERYTQQIRRFEEFARV